MHIKRRKLSSPAAGWVYCAGLLLLALSLQATARDSGHPVSMWQLDGHNNRVYLLGSVHLLRADDHPLPSVIDETYEDAEKVIMELDMDDVDPVEAQSLLTELGLIQDDRSLSDLMGPEYAEAAALATSADIPLSMLVKSEPWLAAITVEQLMLSRIGFNPLYGIEHHFMEKAEADEKEILGLETVEEQLRFLDSMSIESQRALLLQSLKESVDIQKIMDELVDAWRHGDIAFMQDNMLDEMKEYPELYRTIVVDRNRNWLGKIRELLDDEDDYLIIVGALHLIGEDGLPALLAEQGLEVRQLHQEADTSQQN
ncbi:MAG TPA: TraB/GumN family protein [Woeseiaceae bacterium]|nr:TraB/GumN family protein [Woeseiaceae bacterium]